MRYLSFLLLILVPLLGVWTFVSADQYGWWFPVNVSSYGGEIDRLFNLILWMVGITFVGTEVLLAWFFFKYSGRRADKAVYSHGNHRLEMVWTAIPAVLLLFIAFSQMGTWAKIKFEKNFPQGEYSAQNPIGELWASQFDWRMRYPGADGRLGTVDDFEHAFELVVPADTDVVFDLRSRDVIHSFFVPEFRIKQDALPGHTIPVWFRAALRPEDSERGESSYDLVCAELCGWGHYKMAGSVRVMRRDKFDQWLAEAEARWFSNGSEDAQ
jgi:cytochrome c oxidase subunit 2